MQRTGTRTVFLIGLMTVGMALQAQVRFADSGGVHRTPETGESKPQQPDKKPGTGVVPSGVKLVGQMPAGSAPRPYRFPKASMKTLANGIRVFVISDAEQPAVTVRLVLPAAGSIHDPAAKPGVAEMTADLLTQGTATRTAQQIAEAIDFVGGTLNSNADSDGSYAVVTVVKKDLDLGLTLLSDVVRNASFKEEELERRRQQALSGLRIQYADPSYMASAIFRRVIYGEHPYGLPGEGTPDSIARLRRDDMVSFRDARYFPSGALLAFAGDISPEAAFAAAEKHFGDWAAKASAAAPPPAAPPAAAGKGMRILLVDKPDAVQTEIRVGRLGIPRSSADYIPLLVTNRIFGGGYNSRLSTEVRIRKGLTYGAYSNFDARREAGSFVAATATRTEATVEATRVIINLLDQMATGAVTPAEMDFARDYLAGVFPIQTETPEQVAGRILTVEQYGLAADYNDTYQQHILGISPEQVKAMSGKYFAAADLDVVLVGNVATFREALRKEFSAAKTEEMPFDQVDLLAAGLRRAAETAAAVSPEALERGKALLAAAVEAAGAAKVKVESVEATGSTHFISPRGEIDGAVKFQVVLPAGRIRAEVQMPFGTLSQGYDGKAAWMAMGPRARDLPPQMNAEYERDLLLLGGLGLYQRVQAGQVEAAFTGEEDVEGQKLLAADWNAPSGKVKLYFDPATRLLVGARYTARSPQGPTETLELWSDFRDVEGVKVPFRSVTYQDGAKFADQILKEMKLNAPMDPALFSKPPAP